ncbi:hypothetical protein L208DRAFT_1380015 [Tricholoma matsutake]|nr:hypothetical protein L208DRAFT_1380015 [Tricholoma matsutake 945]
MAALPCVLKLIVSHLRCARLDQLDIPICKYQQRAVWHPSSLRAVHQDFAAVQQCSPKLRLRLITYQAPLANPSFVDCAPFNKAGLREMGWIRTVDWSNRVSFFDHPAPVLAW